MIPFRLTIPKLQPSNQVTFIKMFRALFKYSWTPFQELTLSFKGRGAGDGLNKIIYCIYYWVPKMWCKIKAGGRAE